MKSHVNRIVIILVVLFIVPKYVVCSDISSMIPRMRTMEKCQELAAVARRLDIGFPFDQPGRLKYNGFTYLVAEKIKELDDSGLLNETKRAEVLRDIIDANWKGAKQRPYDPYMNFGALQEQEPDMDLAMILATFVISGNTGEIHDIVPYLDFAKITFGTGAESGKDFFIDSLVESEINKDLTPQQKMAFWPAAQAILSHPEITKPLLIEAVQNPDLPELTRLRAAGFLKEIDPDFFTPEVRTAVGKELSRKIQCMFDAESTWEHVTTQICENLQRYLEMTEGK